MPFDNKLLNLFSTQKQYIPDYPKHPGYEQFNAIYEIGIIKFTNHQQINKSLKDLYYEQV